MTFYVFLSCCTRFPEQCTRVSRYQNVSFLELFGDGGDDWSYKTSKAPVKLQATNQHPTFHMQAGYPSCRPTNSVRALKETTEK